MDFLAQLLQQFMNPEMGGSASPTSAAGGTMGPSLTHKLLHPMGRDFIQQNRTSQSASPIHGSQMSFANPMSIGGGFSMLAQRMIPQFSPDFGSPVQQMSPDRFNQFVSMFGRSSLGGMGIR